MAIESVYGCVTHNAPVCPVGDTVGDTVARREPVKKSTDDLAGYGLD
jgi:hypothetical protein